MHLKSGIRTKVTNWYIQKKNDKVTDEVVYPNVHWLSHHIPKTAGTSLYTSYEHAFGTKKILRAYEQFQLARKLTLGQSIWVSKKAKIVHGHFRPHENHAKYFPNAQRIIWLRDPIETSWSLLRHWLKHENGPMYAHLKETYIDGNNHDLENLFVFMLKDNKLNEPTHIFSTYLKKVKKKDFAFIGQVENYNEDLERLADLMGVSLKGFEENVNRTNSSLPFDKEKYKHLLQGEYDFLAQWT